MVGIHGQTPLGRIAMGSVAERTVRFARTPVLVARGNAPAGGYRRALVPVELGQDVSAQLRLALELTSGFAPIDVVHVWNIPVLGVESAGLYSLMHDDSLAAVEREGREVVAPFRSQARAVSFLQHEGLPKQAAAVVPGQRD